jgi:hypothetical protein
LTEAVLAMPLINGMTAAVCAALGISRATVERRRSKLGAPPAIAHARPSPPRALTTPQQPAMLNLLHAPRFADQAPAEIYATSLDEGVYHCSIRTMYRLLDPDAGPGPLRLIQRRSGRPPGHLDQAFGENNGRFVNKLPVPPAKPTATWINPPTPKKTTA